ncbi:MAG: hypothetical protein LBF61_02830 [Azoarcus sp.]|nr:hypothetical protein [Azoarcus sp.]
MALSIRGAGGGGDDDEARTPVETPDNLRNTQYARFVDLLSEGPIVGLVDGLQSIFLDEVPLENPGGGFNFQDVIVETREGTQDQTYIGGFPQVESEVAVAVRVKADQPVVRTITNININAARVTLRIPALSYQNMDNGDIGGTSVAIAIDVQRGGAGWQEVIADTIKGKTTSGYRKAYRIDLPPGGPWDIRMRRLTADSTTSNLYNETWFDSYTEIIDQKLRYPNCALAAIQVDAAQFQRVPVRGYDVRGLIVQVPSNYDPETRATSGIWDGTFKPAWTDNPAWVFYDMATNDRYGLGEAIDAAMVDKWALYEIARYCDELVPDGFGGQEPRFTVFLFLQERQQAYDMMVALANVFRGITYWSQGQISAVQDRPGDVVAQFTAANVIDGQFRYQGSSGRSRHTVALVTWNDPADAYRQTVEAVIDEEAVARYGVIETEIVAFGCKSRGQAHRMGKWLLYSEQHETETVMFRAGLDAARIYPGAIIQTLDPHRAGQRRGGRIVSATLEAITLDAPVTLAADMVYTVSVVLPSGAVQSRGVTWTGDADALCSVLALTAPLDDVPVTGAIWVLAGGDLVPETWRVVSITESDEIGQVEITALAHDPQKFAAVEEGLVLEPRPVTTLRSRPGAVTELSALTAMRMLDSAGMGTRITVSWLPPENGAVRYVIAWRRDEENWKRDNTTHQTYDIDDVPNGTYTIRVVAENALGWQGPYAEITHTVDDSATAPDVQNLRLAPDFSGRDVPLEWDAVPGAVSYRVRVFEPGGDVALREDWVQNPSYLYDYGKNLYDGGPRRVLKFDVTAYSPIGHSANPAALTASNPAPATPAGIVVEAGPGQIGISAIRPTAPDLTGMIVWMSASPDVPTTDDTRVYMGADNAYMHVGLTPGVPMYFKLAFYDAFGAALLNVSSSVTGTPLATGGIKSVTELPESPADVGGDLAVFLDVEDEAQRGLWGWDGEAWKFTRDGANLIANSVTADQLNVAQLSAISANLGTMTAGNLTLDASGFITGGAASWSAGTGFWQGYDGTPTSGAYKWRVGTPGAAGAAWDGTNFTIYGPDGSITLQSGGSVSGGFSSWGDLVTKLGKLDASNVSTVISNAAIGSAQIGDAAITSAKIKELQVETAHIHDLHVTSEKIANGAITRVVSATYSRENWRDINWRTYMSGVQIDSFTWSPSNNTSKTFSWSGIITGVVVFQSSSGNSTQYSQRVSMSPALGAGTISATLTAVSSNDFNGLFSVITSLK